VSSHRPRQFRPLLTLFAVTMATLLVLPVGGAFAQYPPGEDFAVTCLPESPQVGETVTCTVVGAQADEALSAQVKSGTLRLLEASLLADGDGTASFAFDVPDRVAGSALAVTVSGATSGTAAATLQVQEAATDAEGAAAATSDLRGLPRTGTETVSTLVAGVLLLWFGIALVVASRRRAHRRVYA
jgi:hypothetical protein